MYENIEKYKDKKLKDTLTGEVRTAVMQGISDLVRERIENGTIDKTKLPFLKQVILTIRDNDDFWKYFKVHLSSQYGYNLNEIEEFTEDKYITNIVISDSIDTDDYWILVTN